MASEPRSTKPIVPAATPIQIDPAERWARIAAAAYYKAVRREFAPGREVEDWLEAEREFEASVSAPSSTLPDPVPPAPTETPATSAIKKPRAPASRRGATRAGRG